MIKTVSITPVPGVFLEVMGRYSRGEEETGISRSFEVLWITTEREDLTDILEWAAVQGKHGSILETIEQLCLENIANYE